MAPHPLADLTERAQTIFRQVVETYLASGHPVGSRLLADQGGINLSPASIRSVLADLEAMGLLAAPHVSAGRMPTTAGLRLFVDAMLNVGMPSPGEQAVIEERLSESRQVDEALEEASAILSDLSGAAGMVMVPRRETVLAQFSLVPLSGGRALAIMVGEDGQIENRMLDLPASAAPAALEQAANYINARLVGRTLGAAARLVEEELRDRRTALDEAARDLVERGLAQWSHDAASRPVLIVRGQARLLDETALSDLDRVRQLLDDLENKQAIADLLDQAREAEATRIFIGAENRLFALTGSAVIASPYRDREGRIIGVLGVVGPTRLNYGRLVPMVDFTARSLGRRIG
ncbi:heat-inducible transcriptional repressor HrcA [Erythrobacteraceae bacterium CFH 75059]|uniref:heat-inducible transcriptional repressor HrcA n=1 Tax=Qipengyuania thermophila TaxID=2509361 RepID=UPI0010200178|nr:heat-inducible transcriptional repressor HrcA [Qipengyuania thermophila]TCD05182.1 heat-inducible transcriptional repressor HrcA [Erythrobacteraceae bacterium CFH 75059]